eukprot:CAMPEP_0170075096 /NCGR_PEP_ID=MMETSP0019_2-20121128/12287_1 /TAXON_ID=98059 /ORGANISM="Dinobryon sp., Strain UTEXLB2267" /LENGTH=177 /DNA_ID=CAMNT_0010285831 /DNA_START=111 /DNA_END=644 /DNA_ORIENTATION=+
MIINNSNELEDLVIENSWNSLQCPEKIEGYESPVEDESKSEKCFSNWTKPTSGKKLRRWGRKNPPPNKSIGEYNPNISDDDNEHVILFAPTYNTFSLYMDNYFTPTINPKDITSSMNTAYEKSSPKDTINNKKRKRSVRFADECTYFSDTESKITKCVLLGENTSIISSPNDLSVCL